MSSVAETDRQFMRRALLMAEQGRYSAHPNPRVGCVLVSGNTVVGEGGHRRTGEAHAEVIALQAAGNKAAGSAAYVTLEPCAHQGRTPPCVTALVEAGISRLVVAMEDPNPKVAGQGLRIAKEAGIDVSVGVLAEEAHRLNEGFVLRMTSGRPMVRLKIAASLDGATAMKSGESQWITGTEARADVQRFRAASGAVMTGIETVLHDDPSLTVRDDALDTEPTQPLRVVLDSRLRMPTAAKMLDLPGETLVYCTDSANRAGLEAAGATVIEIDASGGRPDPLAVLQHLAGLEVNDVLVEAGPVLAGALLTHRLVDELVIYQAPHIMGSETRKMVETPALTDLDQRIEFTLENLLKIGNDTRLTLRPAT